MRGAISIACTQGVIDWCAGDTCCTSVMSGHHIYVVGAVMVLLVAGKVTPGAATYINMPDLLFDRKN